MQVHHLRASRTFVKVVHVLGHDFHVEDVLQPGQSQVAFVGRGGNDLPASLVVKVHDQLRVRGESLWRRHLFDAVSFPKPIGPAKGGDARFGAHSSPTEHHELLFRSPFPHSTKLREN